MAEAVDSTEVQQPAAAGDEDDRKLFVGGLPQDASQVHMCSKSSSVDPDLVGSENFAPTLKKLIFKKFFCHNN